MLRAIVVDLYRGRFHIALKNKERPAAGNRGQTNSLLKYKTYQLFSDIFEIVYFMFCRPGFCQVAALA